MTRRNPAIAATLTLALLGLANGPAPAESGHDHGQTPPAASALTLDNGHPWATDEPLRTGMEKIRAAAEPILHREPPRGPTTEEAKGLAAAIRENVAYMIQNCKLKPQADATLHHLIGELLGGADALAAKPSDAESLHRIAGALEQYPRYFDHPGWQDAAEHNH